MDGVCETAAQGESHNASEYEPKDQFKRDETPSPEEPDEHLWRAIEEAAQALHKRELTRAKDEAEGRFRDRLKKVLECC